jgi:predicted DNA-binding transcriptional regulator AlpA
MAQSLANDLAKNGLYGLEHHGAVTGHVETFLRLDDVKRATGLGRSTIYDLMAEDPPRFPRPVKIGGERAKAVAWLASEVLAWQRERVAARDQVAAA